MKKFIKLILLSTLIITLFQHCSEKKVIEKQTLENLSNNNGQIIDNKRFENKDFVKNLTGDTLSNFLPVNVPGTKKTPFKTGQVIDMDKAYTVASCEYEFSNHGFLKYSITDFGNKNSVPKFEMKLFNQPPEESGKTMESVVINNGTGYIIWDASKNEGSFYGLLIDRFIIRIDGYSLPKSVTGLQGYIKYFQLDALSTLK
jgi:hypothetical protein